ncbi:MAG: putative quinol monooxygenase [Gemmataceae bacterium]
MIHVLATIKLQPGQRAAWLAEFKRLTPLVLAEDGCVEYGVAVDVPTGLSAQGPVAEDEAVVVEKWSGVEALKAHLAAAHMAAYREKVKAMVAGVALRVLAPG